MSVVAVGDLALANQALELAGIGGRVNYFAGFPKEHVSPISCPDNVAFDGDGNLWVATDGNALGHCDGMYLMPLEGKHKGHLQQFLSVPAHAECCGPLIEWDDRVVFAAIQHPGESDGATTAAPTSLFPYQGNTQPRPSVIMIWPEAKGGKGAGHGHGKGKGKGKA